MKKYIALAVMLLLCGMSSAQAVSPGMSFFNEGRYAAAMPLLLAELKANPQNARIMYAIGVAYLQSRSQQHKAADYLQKAIAISPSIGTRRESGPSEAREDAWFYYAEALEHLGRFDEAEVWYGKYRRIIADREPADTKLAETDMRLRACRLVLERQEELRIDFPEHLIKTLRSVDPRACTYSFTTSPDKKTVIHTVKTPPAREPQPDDKYYEPLDGRTSDSVKKISVAREKQQMKTLRPDTIINVTTTGLSHDGQVILTYRDDQGEGNLYLARIRNNKWTAPSQVAKAANPLPWENNESLTPDGRYMFFVSDRAGGFGGKDIYRCTRTANGWSKAVNMGPLVNSGYDEEAPLVHSSGLLLYFSSNRAKPEIAFDHYMCSIADSLHTGKPVVVGYPVDRNKDEVFYEVNAATKKSGKPVSLSKKELKRLAEDSIRRAEDEKNLLLTFNGDAKCPSHVITGEVRTKKPSANLPGATIEISDHFGKPRMVYHADKDGRFSIPLPASGEYAVNVMSDGLLFGSLSLATATNSAYYHSLPAVELAPVEKGSVMPLRNVLFDSLTAVLKSQSSADLKRLAALMKDKPKLKITVSNQLNSPESGRRQKRLSRSRAEAVKTWLVKAGIDEDRVRKSSRVEKLPKEKKDDKKRRQDKTNESRVHRAVMAPNEVTVEIEDID